jgi:alpha-D-xyloside xylohydrolase
VQITQRFAKLKNTLMPYLYGAAVTARTEGTPVLRPMVLEFPADPGTYHLDRQYMLGEDLLVAPVFDEDGLVEYYVPNGVWTDLLTGAEVAGPSWQRAVHGLDSLPVLVRPGSVIPFGAKADRPDYPYADGVTLRVTRPIDAKVVRTIIPALDGSPAAVFTTERTADVIRFSGTGLVDRWSVLLVGAREPAGIEGGRWVLTDDGVLVTAESDTVVVTAGS